MTEKIELKDLTREEKIIMWARQWAEYVDDDEIIRLWREKKSINSVWFNSENFKLTSEETNETKNQQRT